VAGERQRPACPGAIQFGFERVFVLESPQALRRGLICGKRHHQDRDWVAVLPAAIMDELRAFPQGLQYISRMLCHGALDGLPGWCEKTFPAAIVISGIAS
jgi:hypothetical protein